MKFDDLKIGMITNDGLITSLRKANSGEPYLNLTGDVADAYYENSNAVGYFMHEDVYIGQCTMSDAGDRDYTEMFERGSEGYINCMTVMMRGRKTAVTDALDDVILIQELLLANMNNKNGN